MYAYAGNPATYNKSYSMCLFGASVKCVHIEINQMLVVRDGDIPVFQRGIKNSNHPPVALGRRGKCPLEECRPEM